MTPGAASGVIPRPFHLRASSLLKSTFASFDTAYSRRPVNGVFVSLRVPVAGARAVVNLLSPRHDARPSAGAAAAESFVSRK